MNHVIVGLDRRGFAVVTVASRAPVSAEEEGVACSSVGVECWGRQKEKDRAIKEHTAAASAWAPDPMTAPSIKIVYGLKYSGLAIIGVRRKAIGVADLGPTLGFLGVQTGIGWVSV
ncbi:hypothetical protein FH972_015403 [Carpinus fangiana]|uniref:Uncharacterized protein n=1 Tax=Carpinus fangiana TaxID=176857 RepID=A0A5N6REI5_9ROSI|nr:hypothetical protein FH972_015403 [Carpinus fangiana]